MQLQSRQKEQPEVNLTSLIDVVFLLLIFFMISTTFEQSSALQVSLPEATDNQNQQQASPVLLAIDARGNMALGEQRLPNNDAETIHNALSEFLPSIQASSLVISADENVAHKHVVTVMDMAGKLGIKNLSIATINKDNSG